MKNLYLSKGTGENTTEMGAYCEALRKAGIIGLNIIQLSSVLPHNSKIILKNPPVTHQDLGKKIYSVLSEIRSSKKGETICAGIGWIKEIAGNGHGIIIEIQGNSREKVEKEIKETLLAVTNPKKYDNIKIFTESIICKKNPVCALIAISFEIKDWGKEFK